MMKKIYYKNITYYRRKHDLINLMLLIFSQWTYSRNLTLF